MNLTKHFTLEELLSSDAAVRLDIAEQFTPPKEIIDNLILISRNVLEPLRKKACLQIQISSGYRCIRVNKAIGGAKNSQHLLGQAADISIASMTTEASYQFIKNSDIVFDQLIQEFDRWVHISYSSAHNRRQCLRAIKQNGKTVYLND